MKISLVVPYIDQLDKLSECLKYAFQKAGAAFELITIDNGSDVHFNSEQHDVRNETNIGVLPTFKQGFEASRGDIILFIHSDVLIHEKDWIKKLSDIFEPAPKLGLVGFLGARGIGEDGGRIDTMSNLQGDIWGGCKCHATAGGHHGTVIDSVRPATVLDGMAMAFRREVLEKLLNETDMFEEWRAPHHFYDKILSLKTIQLGYKVAVIPFECDHWSGATANQSEIYKQFAGEWLRKHGIAYDEGSEDLGIYKLAEQQMFSEFRELLPITVGENWEYYSRGEPWPGN